MAVSIGRLSFEHYRVPLGINEPSPRISWRFEGTEADWEQTGYDLEVKVGSDGLPEIFSVNSSNSVLVPWPASPLTSGQSASVRVRVSGGQSSTPWSDTVSVETGLLDTEDWAGANVIAADKPTEFNATHRPVHFRQTFTASSSAVRSARLYITALGMYEAEINGQRVGDAVLAPGWQSYNHCHAYDTYDVTEFVQDGQNAIGILGGEGWYSGRLGYGGGRRNIYGDTIGVLSLLKITYEDGSTQDALTRTAQRKILEQPEWSTAAFDDTAWIGVRELPSPRGKLVAPDGPHVRPVEERKPEVVFTTPSGKTVVDFGQNLVGWLRLNVGVLENGEVATRPLRLANATDTYILNGNGTQTLQPHFTFHGFRYAQVEGWPEGVPINGDTMIAVVIYSDMEPTGEFETSNALLNKFHENVRWSMKGNFLSIPTDCPQRDERLGWTGDAHAFGPTANYLFDTAGFWRGWLKDVQSEQFENERSNIPPFVIPDWNANSSSNRQPRSVWGDVVVAGPYDHYQSFGDLVMLREQYPSAQAWIDTGISRNEAGLRNRSTGQFADWLDPLAPPESPGAATTNKHLVSDAYLIRMTELLSNISAILSLPSEAASYASDRARLTSAFNAAWVSPTTSLLANETQTALALALRFALLPDRNASSSALQRLRSIIANNDYKVGTGFAGTPQLGFALADNGAAEDFYKMLLQTSVPSWLYQVVQNGTTTWERWDSLLPDGSVNPGEMTSFNHYAFGSVANWMHQVIGGLRPEEPGWRTVRIEPVPGGGLTRAKAAFMSPYGRVESQWGFDEEGWWLRTRVPPNARAIVKLPGVNGTVGREARVGSGIREWRVEGLRST
ncbi:bacterial alpha-L-rhamnosidase 6 hairpin glycosidase domain-containing protein 1 [Elsinoe australis]|uniref:alpha-L-rhamnosidase n=1 Tax=Elsinoe australis TaxID=40998 RepID=A0A4U7B7Q2_9PEZI|nr:bacterial alpha-L-rhamnosidase 6 hairpin glycosidase domain-containing protein 1 [Elsinoe australis]